MPSITINSGTYDYGSLSAAIAAASSGNTSGNGRSDLDIIRWRLMGLPENARPSLTVTGGARTGPIE